MTATCINRECAECDQPKDADGFTADASIACGACGEQCRIGGTADDAHPDS